MTYLAGSTHLNQLEKSTESSTMKWVFHQDSLLSQEYGYGLPKESYRQKLRYI